MFGIPAQETVDENLALFSPIATKNKAQTANLKPQTPKSPCFDSMQTDTDFNDWVNTAEIMLGPPVEELKNEALSTSNHQIAVSIY